MKNLIIVLSAWLSIGIASSYAQQNTDDSTTIGQDIKQAGKATGKAVEKAGKKVGEVSVKAVASVKDKPLKNVKGPYGETVYVDKYDRKYYINKNAKRIFL